MFDVQCSSFTSVFSCKPLRFRIFEQEQTEGGQLEGFSSRSLANSSIPSRLDFNRQDAKLAKVRQITSKTSFLGVLGVLAVNF
jgi:hypothetical protein